MKIIETIILFLLLLGVPIIIEAQQTKQNTYKSIDSDDIDKRENIGFNTINGRATNVAQPFHKLDYNFVKSESLENKMTSDEKALPSHGEKDELRTKSLNVLLKLHKARLLILNDSTEQAQSLLQNIKKEANSYGLKREYAQSLYELIEISKEEKQKEYLQELISFGENNSGLVNYLYSYRSTNFKTGFEFLKMKVILMFFFISLITGVLYFLWVKSDTKRKNDRKTFNEEKEALAKEYKKVQDEKETLKESYSKLEKKSRKIEKQKRQISYVSRAQIHQFKNSLLSIGNTINAIKMKLQNSELYEILEKIQWSIFAIQELLELTIIKDDVSSYTTLAELVKQLKENSSMLFNWAGEEKNMMINLEKIDEQKGRTKIDLIKGTSFCIGLIELFFNSFKYSPEKNKKIEVILETDENNQLIVTTINNMKEDDNVFIKNDSLKGQIRGTELLKSAISTLSGKILKPEIENSFYKQVVIIPLRGLEMSEQT